MVDQCSFREDFDKSFENLKKQVDASFEIMCQKPEIKEEVIDLWKTNVSQFISYTLSTSEKYHNKDVFKAITKAMIFGR